MQLLHSNRHPVMSLHTRRLILLHRLVRCVALRVQVWRVPDCPELYQQLRPTFDELPAHFQASRHYHLGIHASHPPMKLLRALQAAAHSRGGAHTVSLASGSVGPSGWAVLAL